MSNNRFTKNQKDTPLDLEKTLMHDYLSRDILIPFMLLLYLRWIDFQDAEQEAIAAFEEIEYQPLLPTQLHWRSWHSVSPIKLPDFFNKKLLPYFEQLNVSSSNDQIHNLRKITPLLTEIERLSSDQLEKIIYWIAESPFETPSDRRKIIERFDNFIIQTDDRNISEIKTPNSIVELIVNLVEPSFGERIYDPCFGSAGFLTAATKYVLGSESEARKLHFDHPLEVFGVEHNQHSFLIGLVRLVLWGIENPHLELGDSLEREVPSGIEENGFDLVLANPPWGMRRNPKGLDHFSIKTSDVAGLFIQHALSHLNSKGRAAIVIPQGFLFRGGNEKNLRHLLIEKYKVEAVVSLPAGVFQPLSGIQSAILLLRRSGPTDFIRMADTSDLFELSKDKKHKVISQEKLKEFVQEFKSGNPKKYCWDVEANSLTDIDWDLTPKKRDLSGLSGLLDSLKDHLEILPLKDCCKILIGKNIKTDLLLDSKPTQLSHPEQLSLFDESEDKQTNIFDVPEIPYIRIKDIQHGQAIRGSSWLAPEAINNINNSWKLKAGDILLSKSGTIGKSGIVRNGGVGAIATSGLYIIRYEQEKIDPHFLIAYLNSKECQSWLDDMARGATIRHLSKKKIEEMPIPVPPLQVQHRVASYYREFEKDAFVYLIQLLTNKEEDPTIAWIDEAHRILDSTKGASKTSTDVEPLLKPEVLGERFTDAKNWVAKQEFDDYPLIDWIDALSEVSESLLNSNEIPPGPALYSLLINSAHILNDSEAMVSSNLPIEKKAFSLTRALRHRIIQIMQAMINSVDVSINCQSERLQSGVNENIELSIENKSVLPFRNFKIQTNPQWGEANIKYFAEKEQRAISLSGQAPKELGNFSLKILWEAKTLDGNLLKGEREIAFIVEESKSLGEIVGLGGSPYVCGDPVQRDRNDVFFGREELLEKIQRQVIQTGNVVLLEGNRRSGKSSILWHLEGINTISGWLSVYCSFQGAEGSNAGQGIPTEEVFRVIARSIIESIHKLGGDTRLPNGKTLLEGEKLGIAKSCREGISAESPFSDFQEYLEMALDKAKSNGFKILLMLDEFDKLQEGIDNKITSAQVPENIRFLVQTYSSFSAILTGSRRIKRLREEYWSALYGIGTRFGVSVLSEEASERLIAEPVIGKLTYSKEAISQIISITARQPYLLQCLCNRIFDIAAQKKIRSITADHVVLAAQALLEDNEHFASLWDYVKSYCRRFILFLCWKEISDSGQDSLQLGAIQDRLLDNGIEIEEDLLISDIQFLHELELIELISKAGGGYYKLTIPLMGYWINKHQDFEMVRSKARLEIEDIHE